MKLEEKIDKYLDEGKGDKLSTKVNKFLSWGAKWQNNPEEMKKNVKDMSDEDLKVLSKSKIKGGSGSARDLKQKLVDREMKKRGLK